MKVRRNTAEHGQVLVVGIVMMLILLLALLFLFDVHNVIRAKFKVETAQQAAALAGAEWQRESLNLIGEINLIKACETLLAGNDALWRTPAPPTGAEPELRDELLEPRIRLLTEMQTRVSFIGPLIGFAAAQQAAKANGLTGQLTLGTYVGLLRNDDRYIENCPLDSDGEPLVNGYRWRLPYLNMVQTIIDHGIAVYPNARLTNTPEVRPSELLDLELYQAIQRHKQEIEAGTPPEQTSWHDKTYRFIKNWRDSDFTGRWWDIDYTATEFPRESEIFTLGIDFSAESDWLNGIDLQSLLGPHKPYTVATLPGNLDWCFYDDYWYPDYYRQRYDEDYTVNHYDFWFQGGVLRRNVKPQYIYEGPAAYAEGYVNVDAMSRYTVNRGNTLDVEKRFRTTELHTSTIGTRREDPGSSAPSLTDYRPGAIARALGELENNQPPIAIPLVLPVFEHTALMPTYMPIPYNFNVLRTGESELDRFIRWLDKEDSLFELRNPIPDDLSWYLEMLRTLTDGRNFRCYGYNPDFDAEAFDDRWRDDLKNYFREREEIVYTPTQKLGPGWLQEPQYCYLSPEETAAPGKNGYQEVTDFQNGGIARRYFVNSRTGCYVVVDSTGHIVTNDESDPTRQYSTSHSHEHGDGGYCANCSGGTYNRKPGPPRL